MAFNPWFRLYPAIYLSAFQEQMASLPWHLNLAHSRDAHRLPCSPELATQGRPSNYFHFLGRNRGLTLTNPLSPVKARGGLQQGEPPPPPSRRKFSERLGR